MADLPDASLDLGVFSISLPVKDLDASQEFYEKLGMVLFHDGGDANYRLLRNDSVIVGLFQGHIDAPTLTFNPGLTSTGAQLDEFTDVREIAAAVKAAGAELHEEHIPEATGAAHIVLTDPDGHPILIDQFF